MEERYDFAAFISYSSKDAVFARRLHRALEHYAIPKPLGTFNLTGGKKLNRIYPVFRDREELAAGKLGPRIEAALAQARFLIVVCSPQAAASPWVNKEIAFFAGLGRADRVFAIVPDKFARHEGTHGTSSYFPAALVDLSDGGSPLAADARPEKDGFRNAWLKIVAGMLNVNAGALKDRDLEQRRRQRLRVAMLSAAALALTVFGAWYAAERTVASAQSRAHAFASEADARMAEGAFNEAMQLALAGNPSARGWLEHALSPAGFAPSRSALAAATAQAGLLRRFEGHTEVVQTVEFSANGRSAVTASYDGAVRLWDVNTGATVRTFQSQFGPVWGAALSGDASLIAAALDENVAVVWNAQTGEVLQTLRGHEGPVYAVAFSQDGRRVVTGSADMTARVWDAATGAQQLSLAHDTSVASVLFGAEGEAVITGAGSDGIHDFRGAFGTLRIWNAVSGELVREVPGFDSVINDVALKADSSAMAVASQSGAVYLASNGAWEIIVQPDPVRSARAVAFSPDGQYLAVGAFQRLLILDVEAPGEIALAYATPREVRSVAFSPDGQAVLAATGGQVAELWSTRMPEHVLRHDDYVEAIAFSRDGALVATGSSDHTAKIWDARTGALVRSIQAGPNELNPDEVTAVAFSPDGERLVLGTQHTLAQAFEVRTGRLRFTINHEHTVEHVAYSPDGATLITASSSTITLAEADTGQVIRRLENEQNVYGFSVASTGDLLIAGQHDGLRVWNLRDGSLVRRIPTNGEVVSVAMLPDSDLVMAAVRPDFLTEGRRAEEIQVIDTVSGVVRRSISARPSAIALSADGRLATIGVELWDVVNGRRLQTFRDTARAIAISPDGQRVALGDRNGRAMTWRVAPIISAPAGDQVRIACERLAAIGANVYSEAAVGRFPELQNHRPCPSRS